MPETPTEGKHQEAEPAPSNRDSGPQERDSSLGSKPSESRGGAKPGEAGPNGADRPSLGEGYRAPKAAEDPGGGGGKSADPRELSNTDLASASREMSEYIRVLDEAVRQLKFSEGLANRIDAEVGRRYAGERLEPGEPPAGDRPEPGEGLVPR